MEGKRRKGPAYPFPEGIGGRRGIGWKVERGDGHGGDGWCSPADKVLHVPLGSGDCATCGVDHALAVRVHEVGHARLSPGRVPEVKRADGSPVPGDVVLACEDARIDARLKRARVPGHGAGLCAADLARFGESIRALVREKGVGTATRIVGTWAAASAGGEREYRRGEWHPFDATRDHSGVRSMLGHLLDEGRRVGADGALVDPALAKVAERGLYVLRHLPRFFSRRRPAFSATEEAARWLAGVLDRWDPPVALPRPGQSKGGFEDGDGGEYGDADDPGDGEARWSPMVWDPVPRPRRLPLRMRRRLRPTSEGSALRDASRVFSDGAVFGRKQARGGPGGAVLVDLSGSMSRAWQVREDGSDPLWDLVRAVPGAVVAGYSSSEDESGREVGHARILAKDGRAVDPGDLQRSGGNGIDGPMLRWLARQPGPRVWVSDGAVCSDVDRGDGSLERDADAVARAAGIVRVDPRRGGDVAEVVAGILTGRDRSRPAGLLR